LNSLLKHTLELLSHRFRWEQVDLRKDLVDIGRIWADQGQLEQVFLNLVNNALDAMPAGGLLSVRTRKLLTQGRDKVVEVDIVDTGQGIPEDQLARVFEPFFSTKGDGGTGLGLPISLGVIEEHGGNIAIDSEVGVGTTFRVRIPVGNPSV
jgi:two-component system NtrC family sensor kinase